MPSGLLRATAAISLPPAAALALLAAFGAAAPLPALAAAGLLLLPGFAVAWWWARDLGRLAAILRRAEAEEAGAPGAPVAMPTWPTLDELARDIERLARATVARAALVGQLRRVDATIVELLPDPLLVLGGDRSIRRANAAARAAFGTELLPALLRHPGLRAAIDRGFAQARAGAGGAGGAERGVQSAELSLAVPVPREVQATVIVLDPPLADGGQAMVVLSDRTRDRAVERMRADFVANASHELRTPLASLIGFIDTLRGAAADDPAAQQRFLAIMSEQAGRMNRLIDDLLSLSRVELVEHQPPAEQVDLAELLPRLAAAFEPRLAARSVTIAVAVDAALRPITGDADQLAQVLQNLLDNAVKYGRSGGTVRLSAAPAAPGARWPSRDGVVLTVADEGPGIPRLHLPRLTERFYRVDAGRSRAEGGTGLGLAIVKHIVNRHRGQLAIDSEEGVGSTVSVWLPLTQPVVATAAPRRPVEAG